MTVREPEPTANDRQIVLDVISQAITIHGNPSILDPSSDLYPPDGLVHTFGQWQAPVAARIALDELIAMPDKGPLLRALGLRLVDPAEIDHTYNAQVQRWWEEP